MQYFEWYLEDDGRLWTKLKDDANHLKELGIRIDKIKKEYEIKKLKHIILSPKYVFSKEEQMLFYNNNVQVLTKKQLQIVTLLSENLGIIVDFEKFRSYVWNDEPIDNATITFADNKSATSTGLTQGINAIVNLKQLSKSDFDKSLAALAR